MSRRLVLARCRETLTRAQLGPLGADDLRFVSKLFWLWRKHGEPATGYHATYRTWQLRLERVGLEAELWAGRFRAAFPAELGRARYGQPAGWAAARFRQAYLAWVAAGRQPTDVLTLPAQQHLQLEAERRAAVRARQRPAKAPKPAKAPRGTPKRAKALSADALLAAVGDAAA